MAFHLRQFKAFLMYYNRKCIDLSSTLDNDDVLIISKKELFDYKVSPEYHYNIAKGLITTSKPTTIVVNNDFTAAEFGKGIKHDKYTTLI
jgi:hypothetical protein